MIDNRFYPQIKKVKVRDLAAACGMDVVGEGDFEISSVATLKKATAYHITNKNIFLIEQKVRDDHDSTKKRGQYNNFINKIRAIKNKYKKGAAAK